MSKSKFLGRPNLGGWLSMLNVAMAAALELLIPKLDQTWQLVGLLLLVALSVPTFWPMWMVSLHGPTNEEIVIRGILLGLNSIAWGYGLAAIIRRSAAAMRRLRARFRRETEAPVVA